MPANLPITTNKRLYSIAEAATILGVGRTTIYVMRKAGLIRFGKLLNRTVISAEEIDRVVADATAQED